MGRRFGLGGMSARLPSLNEFKASGSERSACHRVESLVAPAGELDASPDASCTPQAHRSEGRSKRGTYQVGLSTRRCPPSSAGEAEPADDDLQRELSAQRVYERLIRRLRGSDAVDALVRE